MVSIILLGACGSIGTQVINIIRKHPYEFKLIGLSSFNEYEKINEIIKEFNTIKEVNVIDESIKEKINFDNVSVKEEGLLKLLELDKDALVVNAISGIYGLKPLIRAIELDLDVALANKESVVCGGDLIGDLLTKHPSVNIYPIDSEHSALFQCLVGEDMDNVDKLIITASGGPFRNSSLEELKNVSKKSALSHPTWSMGAKISIDSATLFNKGLEIIEAHYLYGLPYDKIDAIVHPQSLVHGLVQFKDGNLKALLSPTSMELPIMYALSKGNRSYYIDNYLDLTKIHTLEFENINHELFPSVKLAYKCGFIDGSFPAIYCVANEVAVNAFLNDEIKFLDIYEVVNKVINGSTCEYHYSIDRLFEIIEETKLKTKEVIKKL